TGLVHPDHIWRNVGARPGDVLVLTKALGTGILTTAAKHGAAPAPELAVAVDGMLALNGAASRVLSDFTVHACTDVTGFSLLGHGFEMAHGSGVRLVLDATTLPLLPGARTLALAGQLTGGCRRNRAWLGERVDVAVSVPADLVEIGYDPQTSGGLLAALPEEHGAAGVEALTAPGVAAVSLGGRGHARRSRGGAGAGRGGRGAGGRGPRALGGAEKTTPRDPGARGERSIPAAARRPADARRADAAGGDADSDESGAAGAEGPSDPPDQVPGRCAARPAPRCLRPDVPAAGPPLNSARHAAQGGREAREPAGHARALDGPP